MGLTHTLGRRGIPAALALVLVTGIAHAQERTLSPFFVVEGADSSVDRLPLLGTRVTVEVAGVIADVTVKQTYKNDGPRPIHARYVFPASTRAAVHGLTLTVGGERVSARIREREEAKREYAAAKQAGKNAALLEQQRPNVFTMDVANVMPGQRIEVELRYSELLVPTEGVYEFVYPNVVGPRYSTVSEGRAAVTDTWLRSGYTREGTPPLYTLELSGTVAAGLPVRELISPSHAIETRDGGAGVTFALAPGEGGGGDRDFVLRYRLDGDRVQSGLLLHRGERESFFMAMIQPPRRVVADEIPPREYLFVVDVSGSMMGFPLETAKGLLRDLIGNLRPTDTFNVLLFSGGNRLWSPQSLPATPANVRAAVTMLAQQHGGGGTELLAAVKRAMALPHDDGRSRSVIVVTDGYIAAEDDVFRWIRSHLDQANVFAFGIGSSVNRHLLEGIARAGMGEPFVVLGPAQAAAESERFQRYIQSPVLTGVRVAFEGFDAYDIEPASIPDVMAERPIVVQGKWRGQPAGRVVVTGTTGTGEFREAFDVAGVPAGAANGALRQLWARTRIATLTQMGAEEGDIERRSQIVMLGLTYNLLTRHTSFIAVHERVVNPDGQGEDVTQALPLPAGVPNTAVGGGVGVGSEPGLLWMAVLMLVAVLAMWAWRRTAAAS